MVRVKYETGVGLRGQVEEYYIIGYACTDFCYQYREIPGVLHYPPVFG